MSAEENYDRLIRRCDALILGECLRVLRRHPDLPIEEEDLISEVLIQIWLSMDNIGNADNEQAYVRSIVRYVSERTITGEMRQFRNRDTFILLGDE